MITDNRTHFLLPEGVSLTLTPAGPFVRCFAYLLDFLIRAVIYIALLVVLSFLHVSGIGISFIVLFVLNWLYYIYFEARNGQSPGKKTFKLRVVQYNGLPASFSSIVLRNLLRPVDSLPFGYIAGLLTMSTNRRFQRLGDFAAGTLVVYQQPVPTIVLPESQATTLPAITPTTEELAAIIEFQTRSGMLSIQRQHELAAILAPWLGTSVENALPRLQQVIPVYVGGAV